MEGGSLNAGEDQETAIEVFKKYDVIKAKQVALYKEVLPYYEKAYELKKAETNKPDASLAQALMSLYENTSMDDKYKEMKAIYDASKE